MRMKFHILIILFILTTLGFFIMRAKQASAQTGEALRTVLLSQSGYEEAHSLAYSSDGKYFAVGGISGIYIFDAQKLLLLDYLDTQVLARNVLFLPGGHTLVAGLFDNTIKLWHVPDGKLLNTLSGHQGWVRKISVTRDGSLLASAADDDTIRIWKMPAGDPILTIDKNTQGVRAVAISPDGQLVAGALEDRTVRVWRVADGKLLYTLSGHTDWVRCLAFSPDGGLLASGSFDMNVRLWRMSDGGLERILKGHTSSIQELSFSPDGKALASSAVDETVRLWHVSDGNLIQIFQGYTGFIYALSFSPDGKTIASGSENQLYIWDLKALGIDTAASTGTPTSQADVQSTTPDCRECHHTRGQIEPPRVVYMRCEGCHSYGASLVWCPTFPRASNIAPFKMGYTHTELPAGLPTSSDRLAVLIASPANGEILYSGTGLTAPVFVTGQVFGDNLIPSALQVRLDVWSGEQKTTSLTSSISATGSYQFDLAINPQGALVPGIEGGPDCETCHEKHRSLIAIPNGDVRLVVTVTDSTGRQASDERWVRVDSSGAASVPVQVVDSLTHEPLPGLSVNASAILYEWRGRYGSAVSGSDGSVVLDLEALTQAPTHYQLSVPPQVVNGVLYASPPAQVNLAPGATSHPMVTLTASAQHGKIHGAITAVDSARLAGLPVKAVQLPAGPVFETTLSAQNSFSFDSIPVSRYLIAPDSNVLAQQGLTTSGSAVDLFDSPNTNVSLDVTKGRPLTGKISGEDGTRVPFAWLQVNSQGDVYFIDPGSGRYLFTNLPQNADFVTFTAPGYYSKSQHISDNQETLDVQLVPEAETKFIPWGSGRVTLPPQTNAAFDGSDINLNSGWLWGKNEAAQPLTIHTANVQIHLSNGEFAIENAPNRTAWLYIYQGQAQVQFAGGQAPVEVRSGEMIALFESAQPMTIDTPVILALNPGLSESPVPERIQPTLGARVANWLEKVGVGAVQTITFITYILSLASLFAIPLFVLFWVKKRRKSIDSKE